MKERASAVYFGIFERNYESNIRMQWDFHVGSKMGLTEANTTIPQQTLNHLTQFENELLP